MNGCPRWVVPLVATFACNLAVGEFAAANADCLPQWQTSLGVPGVGGVGGMTSRVNAMAVFDDGMGGGPALYVGGQFNVAGGQPSTAVAKWNGTNWESVGANMPLSVVTALAVFDDGTGGGGAPALYAARIGSGSLMKWNGSKWMAIPGAPGGWLGTLHVHDFGDGPNLIISGGFAGFNTIDGPTDYVARWTGSQWRSLGPGGLISVANQFATFDAGDAGGGEALYAIGGFAFFNPGQPTTIGFGRFDGTNWHGAAGGFNGGQMNALVVHDDGTGAGLSLFAAGGFTVAGGTTTVNSGVAASRIAKWNGTTWSPLGSGVNGVVHALQVFDEDGDGPQTPTLFAAGEFTMAGGLPANRIAKWDGEHWHALGETLANGANAPVLALGVSPDGSALIVGGEFSSIDGTRGVNRIAAWTCSPIVEGDVNGDGNVNVTDLLAVIAAWGPCEPAPIACPADIAPMPTGDDVVNVTDLLAVIANWRA